MTSSQFEISKQVLISLVRYGLISIGAVLVSRGIINEQTADAWLSETSLIIAGAVIAAVTIGWRWMNVRFNVFETIKAMQASPVETQTEAIIALEDVRAEVKEENNFVTSL
jgi:hypothetical protein